MSANVTLELLGRGIGVPLAPDDSGRLPRAEGPEKVRQGIFATLDTEPGERVMRPLFGTALRRFLMQPNNAATRAEIDREVTAALARWEPRIELTEVMVMPGNDPALVLIEIQYVHAFTGRRDSLVYPFFLE